MFEDETTVWKSRINTMLSTVFAEVEMFQASDDSAINFGLQNSPN